MLFRRRPRLLYPAIVGLVIATVVSIFQAGSTQRAYATSNVPTAAQLAAMRAQVAAVQAELTAGTKRLEAAQTKLKQLNQRASASSAAADKLDAKLAGLKQQISQFAGDMYEHPAQDTVATMLSGGDIARSVQAMQLLRFATDSRTQVLREVKVDGQHAKVLRTQADQAVKQGAALQKSIDAQVVQLQKEASAAAVKLEAAQAAYEKEQARLAAEREAKARAAREEAARAAAERARRAAAARAASQPASGGGGGGAVSAPNCVSHGPYPRSGPWGGYSNGLIPSSQLCSIIGGGRLRPDAAIAFNKMTQAYAARFGHPLCINASYRPYSDQVRLYRIQPALSAIPGTSNHGWGLAVDLGCGVQTSGSAQFRWMVQNAGRYGFVHPAWAYHNPFEPWHWEYGRL